MEMTTQPALRLPVRVLAGCAAFAALLALPACAPADGGTSGDAEAGASDNSAQASAQAPMRSYVGPRSPADGDSVLPFSGAVWVGNTLYLSGQLGLENGQVPETAAAEAANVLNNVKNLLESAGLTMDDLVTVQVFSSDVSDYQAFNDVYRTYFTSEFPARAFIGSGTLLFGARFEVQGIAARH